MSRKYEYKCPTELEYVEFKLSRKDNNRILKYRKKNIFSKIEAFYKEDQIQLHYSANLLGILVTVLLFPYYFLAHGFGNAKEIISEYKELFNQKKYGSFSRDNIRKYKRTNEVYEPFIELEKIYKKQVK